MSSPIAGQILDILTDYLSPISAKAILSLSSSWARVDTNKLRAGDGRKLIRELEKGLQTYVRDAEAQEECVERLSALLAPPEATEPVDPRPVAIKIQEEADIVTARGQGIQICSDLGFPKVVQVKVATAISELARNIVQYAGEGEVTITAIEGGIEVVARDQGPGIDHLDTVLSGEYSSETGMGRGLAGTRKLMDEFDVQTRRGLGTEVRIRKFL